MAPTFRMSRKARQRNPSTGQRSRTVAFGPVRRDSIHKAAKAKEITAATAGPRMPSAGRPNQPSVSAPASGICSAALATSARPGVFMSPVPRSTEAIELATQCTMQPRKRMVAKASAPSSAAPLPPSAPKIRRPKPTKMIAKRAAIPSAMASAWAAAASAAALLPEPSARATEDEMPPPMAPADIMPSVICAGNTRASAARAAVLPSWPTKKPSATLTRLCIATFSTLGAASARMVGTIGPASIICRRSAGVIARYLARRIGEPRELIS